MKILFLLLFIQAKAFSLNQTFLRMPENQEYMSFTLHKYIKWHQKNFSFPDESELLSSLISKLDHWIVETPSLRQITLTHYLAQDGKAAFRIRLFVHSSLRSHTAFSGKGLPPKRELMFVEWDNSGNFCQLFRETKVSFTSWCRKNSGNYSLSWTEKITDKVPQGWKIPFPVLGEEIVLKETADGVQEVLFFDVTPHPSLIPKALLKSVFLHTKETLFPLDRLSNTRDGKIGIHYP